MLRLKPDNIIKYNGKQWIIDGYSDSKIIVRSVDDRNKVLLLSIEEIWSSDTKDKETENINDPLTPKQKDIAIKRYKLIEQLLHKETTIEEVKQVAKTAGVHPVTIYRWIKRYNTYGLAGLADYSNKRGNRKLRLLPEQEEIIENMIRIYYLTPQKLSIKAVYEKIVHECKKRHIDIPHYNTIRNRIKSMDKKIVSRDRYGKEITAVRGQFEAKYPLEIVQIDHTKLDIIVVDPIFRRPIGRPYITVAIDVYSRMIYGIHISLDAPSYFSVSRAILMGIKPKTQYLESLGIEGEWPIFGLSKHMVIHTDNAKEFTSDSLEYALTSLNISQEFRPKKKPNYGGHVERFLRTLNEELHKLPGTTFSKPDKRKNYDPEKEAVFTLEELEKYIVEWIVNVYHKKYHKGINMSPEEKWKEGIYGNNKKPGVGYPDLPEREELARLEIELMYTEKRAITREGIKIDYITYWHEILIPYINSAKNKKYTIKVNPLDISQVYFYDEKTKQYYKIPAKNFAFPKMSRWELREVIKYLKENNEKKIDEFSIATAYEKLMSIKSEAVLKSKKARRDLTRIYERTRKEGYLKTIHKTLKSDVNREDEKYEKNSNDVKIDIEKMPVEFM